LLLATLIGAILLSALYFSMSMTLQQTQASREAVDAEDLSRGIFGKMGNDFAGVLGSLTPKCGGTGADSTGTTTTTSTTTTQTTTTTTTPTTGTGMGGGMTSSTTSNTSSTTSSNTGTTDASQTGGPLVPLQTGVIGADTQLVIFTARVPAILGTPGGLNQQTAGSDNQSADMYRVVYWLGANGGLCRQESPWVTSDFGGDPTQPDRTNEALYTIAPEVTNVYFEYTDGTAWTDSWSSYDAPPRAIRVTLAFPATDRVSGEQTTKQVSQVFPIRTGAGTVTPTLTDPVAWSESLPADSSGGGGGGGGSGKGGGGGKSGGKGGGKSGGGGGGGTGKMGGGGGLGGGGLGGGGGGGFGGGGGGGGGGGAGGKGGGGFGGGGGGKGGGG
jgi:hypothetical protein